MDGAGETALDVVLAGLEGESVSPEELVSSFVGNVAANALIGLVGKAISNIAGAKVGNVSEGYKAPKGGGGTTSTIIKGDKTITFGHGARHFEDIPNIDVSDVENAIAEHVFKNPPKIGESPRVKINVNGQIVEYRPYNLGDGRINIGTYIPKNE
ncbi:hypothetical protein [Streptococcus acidominimus]|uniref:Uncharacterized protein n=1 Tax=Streptococcus acidominimus TaxID=1326 RepID=A0A1Q8EEK9_STRAI|nr:hypothetical protein [Streptococcus acidominimus]OLF50224.1 hypothetical protein BU200_02960 [Streptococcus acidominimus]SUN06697.1 Uncharacterised protein [Streptococcus acidominimus]